MKFQETLTRSISKAISYRALIMVSDALIVYFITHKVEAAFAVIVFSNIASTVFYFLHERLWANIHWGKKIKK